MSGQCELSDRWKRDCSPAEQNADSVCLKCIAEDNRVTKVHAINYKLALLGDRIKFCGYYSRLQ